MLLDYIIPLKYTSRPINTFILEDLFRKEAEYLQIYRKEIANLNSQNSLKNREEIDLIINKMKISVIIRLVSILRLKQLEKFFHGHASRIKMIFFQSHLAVTAGKN